MKPLTVMLAIFFVTVSPLFAQEELGFHQYQALGDYKTPLIPGSEFRVHQPDRAQPPRVLPGNAASALGIGAPSDAIQLFKGGALTHFQENEWEVRDGELVATRGGLRTKKSFGDCQLHVEWKTPTTPNEKLMSMGNSGIKFMGCYELQIFDSYTCKIYADGSAGAIYGQTPPMVNVCRQPGQWQSFDVVFTAPKFKESKLVSPARITVLHNGVLIHLDTEILGPTVHKKAAPYKPHPARLPILFQAHGSPVAFRNMWIRDLEALGQ